MKKLVLLAALLGVFAVAPPTHAEIGTIDNVPAATLLLPYFEVDLDDPNGVTTLFSINNASATAVLAHVSLWSDLSVHVFDFMVYLTGYDVVTINLRDVLEGGVVPTTADDARDPQDTISNQGSFSQDITFPGCAEFFPLPEIPPVLYQHNQDALTGQPSFVFGGLCSAQDFGDWVARGYVIVNTVNQCTIQWPGNPGFFVNGGSGIATNQNVLFGDYFYTDPKNDYAQGDALVHIEADGLDPETSVPGEYTFFGRYVGWTAADNREPLSTTFGARFVDGGVFDGGTDLVVWRDSKVDQDPFVCGTAPAWYPLGQEQVVIFDEQENPSVIPFSPFSPQPPDPPLLPFPAEANRTEVGGPELPVPWDFGWLLLNLNTTVTPAGANPPEDPAAAQAWVSTVQSAKGRFSVGYPALLLDSATNVNHLLVAPQP